ncbi:MAG: helix-turn-helix domain-containing protein [Pyrinomonadaceae bacterium]
MLTINNPNEANIAQQMWQKATTPRISILRQLANKLLSEVESINEGGRFYFGEGFKLSEQIQKFEIDMIRHALYLTNGRQTDAARMLGIKVTTLNAKIKRYHIDG